MSNSLKALADLRNAHAVAESYADYTALWAIVERIEAHMVGTNPDKQELQALDGVKSCVSEAILNSREGLQQPHLSVKVFTLEEAIKRNTIGPDGWPLAKR